MTEAEKQKLFIRSFEAIKHLIADNKIPMIIISYDCDDDKDATILSWFSQDQTDKEMIDIVDVIKNKKRHNFDFRLN